MDGIDWETFLRNIKMIHAISQQLNDNWEIVHISDEIAGTYLMKTVSMPLNIDDISNENIEVNDGTMNEFEEEDHLSFDLPAELSSNRNHKTQLIKFEYHVLYHISYAVPYLCFNAHKSNGSSLTLDEAWKIFNDLNPRQSNKMQSNMLNILTQMEHPILFRPFLTLHPCQIADVLHSLPNSQNKVLSFLSIYGPTIYLTFDVKYANHFNE